MIKPCRGKKPDVPFRTPKSRRKSAVCVKYKGKIRIVRFGDPNLKIKSHIPKRRKLYCTRSAGIKSGKPKILSPNYWSRKEWKCQNAQNQN